jgi:hypothetical protein
MLFFFELFLFVLVMLTLALGEFVSRGLALTLWVVATAFTLAGYLFARRSLTAMLAGQSGMPLAPPPPADTSEDGGHPGVHGEAHGGRLETSPTDERWARTLLYNWRRTNVLLLIGVVVVGGWYWLGLRG